MFILTWNALNQIEFDAIFDPNCYSVVTIVLHVFVVLQWLHAKTFINVVHCITTYKNLHKRCCMVSYLQILWLIFVFDYKTFLLTKSLMLHTQRDFSQKKSCIQTSTCLGSVHQIRKFNKEIQFSDPVLSNGASLPRSSVTIDRVFWHNMHT